MVEQQSPVHEAVPARRGSDVFISYSRRDRAAVERLTAALQDRGRSAWVDFADIPPTAEWMTEIKGAIDAADTVVVVLSPDSVASPVCTEELEAAVDANKRIVPVVVRDVVPTEVPPELAKRNWLFLRETDDFEAGVDTLVTTLETDLEATRFHTGLLVKAREWQEAGGSKSKLLRGSDLTEAEGYVASPGKGPAATQEQTSFVLASRKAVSRRQRSAVAIATCVALVAAAMGVFAWSQRSAAITNERRAIAQRSRAEEQRRLAEEQSRVATSRGLALRSDSMADEVDLSSLLAIEALRTAETPEAIQTAHQAVQRAIGIDRELWGPAATSRGVEYDISFSPDGTTLVSNATHEGLTIWPITEPAGTPDVQQLGHGHLGGFDLSPDGQRVATTPGHQVVVSDVASGEVIQQLDPKSEPIDVAYLPDGTLLVAERGGGIEAWSASDTSATTFRTRDGTTSLVVEASDDGREVAVVAGVGLNDDSTVLELRDAEGVRLGPPLIAPEEDVRGILSVAFDPSGSHLAATTDIGFTMLFDLTGKRRSIQLPLPSTSGREARDVAFSADGRVLAVGTEKGFVLLWDTTTLEPVGLPIFAPSGLGAVAFSPRSRTLAVSEPNGSVKLWDLSRILLHDSQVSSIAFQPDGLRLASAEVSGTFGLDRDVDVHMWDPSTSIPLGKPGSEGFALLSDDDGRQPYVGGFGRADLTFSSDGSWLAFGGEGVPVTVWGRERGRYGVELHHGTPVESVAFDPNGSTLAMGDAHGMVRLRDVEHPSERSRIPAHDRGILEVAFNPAGNILASTGREETLVLSDVETGATMGEPHPTLDWVPALAFSPDGRLLALGSWDGAIEIWDMREFRTVGEPLRVHAGPVFGLTFNPDGTVLASGGVDGTVVLWDVATWKTIGGPLMGHSDWVNDLAFSPDGQVLASASSDRTVVLWDALAWSSDLDALVARLCEVSGRNLTSAEWSEFIPDEAYRTTCPAWPAGV